MHCHIFAVSPLRFMYCLYDFFGPFLAPPLTCPATCFPCNRALSRYELGRSLIRLQVTFVVLKPVGIPMAAIIASSEVMVAGVPGGGGPVHSCDYTHHGCCALRHLGGDEELLWVGEPQEGAELRRAEVLSTTPLAQRNTWTTGVPGGGSGIP